MPQFYFTFNLDLGVEVLASSAARSLPTPAHSRYTQGDQLLLVLLFLMCC